MTWLFHMVSYCFQFFFSTRTESLRQHTMPFVTYPTTQGMPWPAVGLLSLGLARARSARSARSARCRWGIISCPMTPSMCPGPTSPRFVDDLMTWSPWHGTDVINFWKNESFSPSSCPNFRDLQKTFGYIWDRLNMLKLLFKPFHLQVQSGAPNLSIPTSGWGSPARSKSWQNHLASHPV